MKKIVALGDSITKGVIFDGSRYSIAKSSFVSQCAQSLGLPIENLGKMGCTIDRGAAIADRHQEAITQSDITLVEFGGNDCDFSWHDIAGAPDDNHYPTTELPRFRQVYANLINRIKQLGSQPVLLSLPLIDYHRFYSFVTRDMGDEGRQNIYRWLGGQEERIRNYHDMYTLAVYQVGYQEQVPVIDITSPFLQNRDYRPYLCCDGIHPSQQGHDLIARTVESSLRAMI